MKKIEDITFGKKLLLQQLNQQQLNDVFISACRQGNINMVRYVLKSPDLKHNAKIDIKNNAGLIVSSVKNHIEVMKYLLNSPELIEHASIHANNDEALISACLYGSLEAVKYLLTSPDLNEYANIHAQGDMALINACWKGDLRLVKYLLTSPDLKEQANIHANEGDPLLNCSKNGHVNVMDYLLTSPELKEHATLYTKHEHIFRKSYFFEKKDVFNYLMFRLKIEKTKEIENYLIVDGREDIIDIFNKRDLEIKLQKKLKVSEYEINMKKTKL